MIRQSRVALKLVFLFAACGSPSEPDSPPTIEGPIVAKNVEMAAVSAPSIHVKESTAAECGIVFAVSGAEVIRQFSNGSHGEGNLDDLAIGRDVRVWSNGVVLESCPGQSSAKVVVVLM